MIKNMTIFADNALRKSHKFRKNFRDKKTSLKVKQGTLSSLFHFMGDIHQPLHLGNQGDREGNRIMVHYENKLTNLHELWDRRLILRKGKNLVQYARKLFCKAMPKG